MSINPASRTTQLNNPTQRANELNDPQFKNQQGYFPYDLTHQEFITPRFGEATPSMWLHTSPADRIVFHDNTKTILNQINGNLLSIINQYVDTFYVPMRSLYPINYEKLIPNPTKGDDLPNSALPQFPFRMFLYNYLKGPYFATLNGGSTSYELENIYVALDDMLSYGVSRLLLLATVLSRGQLLDYLGCAFDSSIVPKFSILQKTIDSYFAYIYGVFFASGSKDIIGYVQDLSADNISFDVTHIGSQYHIDNLSTFRDAVSTSFERGEVLHFNVVTLGTSQLNELAGTNQNFVSSVLECFGASASDNEHFEDFIDYINTTENPFNVGFINIEKPLAYQQIISQYYTNNSVDNIFNSELFMQNLSSIMFPSTPTNNMYSSRPTFDYNGVNTEYDLISAGATFTSLIAGDFPGTLNRQYVWLTIMLLLRRTLRYGDYFSTARPNMLAVGQLSIDTSAGSVSPVDITKNLLMQRYLNAANYIGSGFLPYFASIYGVTPSDTGTFPRFISHRKIELQNDVVTNTANNQGAQTTNLIGFSDNNAADVFIDDIGLVISLVSYDVLPVYKSGIDASYHLADRFDYFNPMLQGVGDQSIRKSELIGFMDFRNEQFGWTMRNAEYKYKISRAHGAFVNSLPGLLVSYPLYLYGSVIDPDLHINPDFIRDKPAYLDSLVPNMSGISPAEYFHFAVSVTNQLQCARKIQATPPVLF